MTFTRDAEVIGGAVALVAVIALAIYVSRRPGASFGEQVGETIVSAADGVAAGVAKGVGRVLGVPDTDAGDCSRALASGRWWDASFACPAKDFVKGVFSGAPVDTGPDNWDAKYWGTPAGYVPQSVYELPGVVLP